ncbi:MAG: tetratricopeptide repeat protein [Elusimicrobia bacterium]|nr:tetratricopeptide repeat protein [Elusimicrobiota bacterium]
MTRFLFLLLGMSVWACGSVAMAVMSVSQQLQAGKQNFEAGNYSRALDHFFEVLKFAPENIEAKIYITRIGESGRQLEQDARFTPEERKKALEEVALLLQKRKQKLSGLHHDLRQISRQLESANPDPQGLLKASLSLSRFKELEISDQILRNQSQAYIEVLQAQLRKAIQRGGVFQNPKDVLVARGFLWYYKDDYENALKEWRKALALSPGDSMLREQVEWVSKKKTLRERDQTIQELFKQASALYAKGQYDQSLLYWKSLVVMEPDNKEFQRSMMSAQEKVRKTKSDQKFRDAKRELERGRLTSASQLFLEVLEIDPTHPQALEELKQIQHQLNQKLASFNQSKKRSGSSLREERAPMEITPSPKLSEEQYTLGIIYYAQGDLEKARRALEDALQYDPANEKAKNALERIRAEILP